MFRNRKYPDRMSGAASGSLRRLGPRGCRGRCSVTVFWGALFGLLAAPGAGALESPLEGLSEGDRRAAVAGMVIFEAVYNDVWSGKGATDSSLERLDRSAELFAGVGDSSARAYLLGRAELYRGRIIQVRETKAKARPFYEKAMQLAQESLGEGGRESAEAYRLLADAASSWMLTKGLGALIRTAPKVSEWADRAVEMNPENAMAVLIGVQGQINAPKSAGGDPDEALKRLLALNRRGDLSRAERFWTRASLSAVYGKLKQRDEAEIWCGRAREIFPDNPFVKDCG